MKKKVLITGSSGFVGHQLLKQLSNKNHNFELLLTSRKSKHFNDIKIIKWDLEKNTSHTNLTFDILIHLAAETKNFNKMWAVNFVGTKNIIRSAIKSGVKKIIFLSSISALKYKLDSKKINLYGKTKSIAEDFIKRECIKNKIDYIILRPTNILGLNHDRLPFLNLIKSIKNGSFTFLGELDRAESNYISNKDVCRCIIFFLENKCNSSSYILNDSVKLIQIVRAISNELLVKVPKRSIPISIGKFAAKICDFIQNLFQISLPYNSDRFLELINTTKFNGHKICDDTNFIYKNKTLDNIIQLTKFYLKNKYV